MAILNANLYSNALMRTVPVTVVLPSDKVDANGKRMAKGPFKTLYLLHGIFGDNTDWMMGTRIVRWAMDHNLAVVMPAGENHFYVNHGRGQDYGEFIGKELVELTREMFPLSTCKEDTFIGGLSMGGWGAMINGLRNPDTFGGVISLSGAILVDEMIPEVDSPNVLEDREFNVGCSGHLRGSIKGSEDDLFKQIADNVKNHKEQRFYVACGTEDPLLPATQGLYGALTNAGFPVTLNLQPGGHEWDFWDSQIEKVIDWIEPAKEAAISSGNIS
ncbi:alpha/beta hydrolase family protein [Erysipelotrichaceae bacterium 51-3]